MSGTSPSPLRRVGAAACALLLAGAPLLGQVEDAQAVTPGDGTPGNDEPGDHTLNDPPTSLVDVAPEDVLRAGREAAAVILPTTADMEVAVDRGLSYLLGNQNEDGSWGGWQEPGPYDEFWSNPHSHYPWVTATTGLVAMSLLELPETPSVRAGLEQSLRFIVQQDELKRPSGWDVDNTWGYVYGLQTMTRALADPRYASGPLHDLMRDKARHFIDKLAAYQSPDGGWGYYDSGDSITKRPTWSTSFMTAATIVGLEEARRLGLESPEGMLERAVAALVRCRLPNGAYAYSVGPIPTPGNMEGINQVKGSLSRIQAGNYALQFVGHPDVDTDDVLEGLDRFFEHHRFLDVARQRPVPHEAYYANAGYFYYFGHFYAGLLVEQLAPTQRVAYRARLAHELIKTQESDGSMWDYYMNSYHRPYGTAFGLMALRRCMPTGPAFEPDLPAEPRRRR